MAVTRKKPKRIKKDATDRLYRAVAAYLKSKGGMAIVVGGIQIIEWPSDQKYHFTVGIKVTGHKPKFPAEGAGDSPRRKRT